MNVVCLHRPSRLAPTPVFLVATASFLVSTASLWSEERPTNRPNILLLLADDLGYGELGCQGNPQIPTPHIDSIAGQGIRCLQGYVTAPNCSPSRAGLLTGRIGTRFGYEMNPIGAQNDEPQVGLPHAETTLAELLRSQGYATGLIGKWHLGGSAAYHPQRHGFDEFWGFLHEGHFYVPPPWHQVTTMLRRTVLPDGTQGQWQSDHLIYSTHMGHNEPPYDANNPILRAGQPVVEEEYLTDAISREATDFIRRHRQEPFFLFVAYNAVHSPLQATHHDLQQFAHLSDIHRRIFAGMLASLDRSVGEILAELREQGLERETLLFFLSDNGGPTRELTSSNRPLRGEKGEMYEGGLRVPFLVRWTDHLPAGSTYQPVVSATDIFATAATAAGAELPKGIDGVDLLPFLTGKQTNAPHETLYWRQGARTALRHGDWKLIQMRGDRDTPRWELYDLSADMREQHDLAESQPDVLQSLIDRWQSWDNQMSAASF